MANFSPSEKKPTDFNGGVKFVNKKDAVDADDINNVIESALYSQQVAQNATSTANTAKSIATGIDGKVEQAISTSNKALSNSQNAVFTANRIDGKATEALNTANNVKNSFNDILITKGAGTQVLEGDVVQGKWNADTKAGVGDAWQYKFNQIIPSGIYSDTNIGNALYNGATFKTNGLFEVTIASTSIAIDQTHKYYCDFLFEGNFSNVVGYIQDKPVYVNGNIVEFNFPIITGIKIRNFGTNAVDGTTTPILIDLTDMFGAGNEPSTVEELYKIIKKDTYYPYRPIVEYPQPQQAQVLSEGI